MRIICASEPVTSGEIIDTVVLDGGAFFQPRPVVDQARRFAREGVAVVVTLSLEHLGYPRFTGVTRMVLEAAVESRLRGALYAAGYRNVCRRGVSGVLVLDARA